MPGPDDAGIDRRKAVQRHQHGGASRGDPLVDDLVDAAMIGVEDRAAPHLGRLGGQALIAGNGRGLADQRDRACHLRRPVAVDHEPRVALRNEMRAERLRQRLCDAGDPDVEGDVAREFFFRQPEMPKHPRDQPAIMIAGEEERRRP
jgi:hypothetical protein